MALDAALLSRPFNQDDLEVFSYVPESDRSLLYQWLIKQPFVRSLSQDGRYLYHDVARDLFIRHRYQNSPKRYDEVRRALATYYQELLEKIQTMQGKEVYRSEEWLELLQAVVIQLFLLQDQACHIKAIECILGACEHTTEEQDTTIAKTLRDLSQESSPYPICPTAREIAIHVLHYIELVRHIESKGQEEWLAASEVLLKKVAHAPSFPSELLAGIYARRGYACLSLKEYRRAIENIQQAFALGKRAEAQTVSLTLAYRSLGDREQAFAYFDRLVALNSTDSWAYHHRGWNYFYFGEYEQAIADFDRVLNLDPCSDSAYHGKGWAYYRLREYQQAMSALTKALELNPCRGYVYGAIGLIYQERKEYQQATIYFDRFVEVDSENYDAYVYRGDFRKDCQEEYQQALADFNRAIELAPGKSSWLYCRRGLTHLWLKDLRQAQADFTRSHELEPTYLYSILMTEWVRLCWEAVDPSISERLETIGEVDPPNYTSHTSRGIALLLRRNFKKALIELEQALLQKRSNDWWEAHFWKGIAHAFLGQDEEAIVAIEKALDLGLPPILLAPLNWFEQEKPDFYEKYVVYLLAKHA